MGSIYKITCKPTGLVYIGQACDTKTKCGKPYRYGAEGRWSDHVSSSKKQKTPLACAIQTYGREQFSVSTLEHGVDGELDALEAKWIHHYKCIHPLGLNVARHARSKHHIATALQEHYKGSVADAIIRPIRRDGEYRLVHVYLHKKDGATERLCFGQNADTTFLDAMDEARAFVASLECPVIQENTTSCILADKYATKLAALEGKEITKVRITSASKLVAVYITTSDMTSYKDQIRICFGGKHVSSEDAYNTAQEFIELLKLKDETPVDDSYQSKSATGDSHER
jgi:hypothetical protein